MTELYITLKQFGKVKVNEPLAKHTTFKIGGAAELLLSVTEKNKLVSALQYLDGEGVPYIVIGGGSNMLAPDIGFHGVIIEIKTRGITTDGLTVTAEAGCSTVEVAQKSVQAGLAGFEWGIGVPGTIGGAVRGNAGAMGGEMKSHVVSVEAYVDGEVVELTREECKFEYRGSRFKHHGGVVLSVTLSLQKATSPDGMKKAIEYLQYRNRTQPQGFSSTGCIFQNPDFEANKEQLLKHFDRADEKIQQFAKVGKISAGWLVEQVGMKGEQIGNAQVSEKHGNFIVNLGGATASDVLSLVEKIKTSVYTTYKIQLEEEIYLMN